MATTSHEMPTSVCPECGHTIEWATSEHAQMPNVGDWCVCIECTAPLRFGDDLKLRITSLAERNTAPAELLRVIRHMVLHKRK